MKNLSRIFLVALMAVGLINLVGCADDDPVGTGDDAMAKARILVAAEMYPSLDISIDGKDVATNALFADNIAYADVRATNVVVKVTNTTNDSVLYERTVNMVEDRNYTLFVTNDMSGIVDVLVFTDDLTAPASGKVLIRPIHLINDGPQVRIGLKGTGVRLTDSLNYGEVFEIFNSYDAGTYTVRVIATSEFGNGNGSGGADAVIEGDITFEAGGIYSAAAIGTGAQPQLALIKHN